MADNNKHLKQLLHTIAHPRDLDLSAIDEATHQLNALKISKIAAAASSPESATSPVAPEHFRCPISGELMKDPVLLATGQTYDRSYIEKWFHEGQNTCPRTKEVLSDMTLTPNRLLRSMIVQWCLDNKLEISKLTYEEEVPHANASHLNELLNKLSSSSLSDQKVAAVELREITRTNHEFRALFEKLPDSIERLLYPSTSNHHHPDLQVDLITTLLNISVHDENKKPVAENPFALPLLIQSLQHGSFEMQANAAATIFSLCFHEANKMVIGNAGALEHLVVLLDVGHPVVIRDVASAILKLCTATENREKAVCTGAVNSILRQISHGVFVDELVPILYLLSKDLKAIDEMCKLNTVSCMLRILRKTASQCIKEKCVSILYSICKTDRSKLKEIRDDENANGTILELSRLGNSRAKRKAIDILELLERTAIVTNTT